MYFNSNANRRPPFSTTRPAALAGLLLAATWLPTLPAKAQCFDDNLAKVVAGSSLINDHMGEAVAVHGDVAVLGSPDDEEGGFMNAGSVSVFRRDPGTGQWTEEQRVVAGDPSGSAFFGRSVDIYGDTLIVGNTEHSPAGIATGAAYIFRYDGVSWNEEQKLTLAAPDPGDRFGFSVGIWGDTAVVGADSRDVGFEDDAGSAYVYEFNGLAWISVATLVAPDALEDAFLGHSIAIHDNWIIAGAWADNANFLDGGAAYIFSDQGAGWAYFQKIISNNLAEDDLFGTAVDIHGNHAIVGAQFHDTLGQNRGAAYIFEIGMLGAGWLQVAEVTASDVEPFDRFGIDVAIDGDTALVGSFDDAPGNLSGAAYLYRFDGIDWIEQTKIESPDLAPGVHFGSALDLDATTAVFGSPLDGGAAFGAGAGYFYDVPRVSLDIAQSSVLAGDSIDFQLCGAIDGEPTRLQLIEVSGVPTLLHVVGGAVPPGGLWAGSYLVPLTYAGDDLVFRGLTLDNIGTHIHSNTVEVEVN